MRAGAAGARNHGTRAVLRDLATAIRDGISAGEFAFYAGRPDMENGDPENRGRSAVSRAYSCRDGEWLFISVFTEPQWKALLTILSGLPKTNWDVAAAAPNEGPLAN